MKFRPAAVGLLGIAVAGALGGLAYSTLKTAPERLAAPSRADVNLDAAFRAMMDRLGPGHSGAREGIFLIAGNIPPDRLWAIAEGTVRRCSEALWRQHFARRPAGPIYVYLYGDDASFRAGARALTGREPSTPYGFYSQEHGALVMNIATGSGTLVHEMTHPLMRADFPEAPAWLFEGLGSLYEQCAVEEQGLRGLVNWRLPGLLKAARERRLVPLEKLLAMSAGEFYGPNAGLHYAQARYLLMYLQDLGLLERFYRDFRDGFAADRTGRLQLERLLGKLLQQAVPEWLAWLGRLPPYRR